MTTKYPTPLGEPRTGGNYAAELRNTRTNLTRSLAVPAGLTHDQALAWLTPWLGADEVVAQFVTFN